MSWARFKPSISFNHPDAMKTTPGNSIVPKLNLLVQPLYSEWPYLIPGALKLGQRGTLLFYNYYQSSDDLTAKPICQNKDQVKYRLARCIPWLIRLLNNCMCTVWMVKVILVP